MRSSMSRHIARRPGRFIALAGALVAFSSVARAQIAVDELELHIAQRRGGAPITATFHAVNRGITPSNATVTIQDWDRSEGGENRYYPSGTLPMSCGARSLDDASDRW